MLSHEYKAPEELDTKPMTLNYGMQSAILTSLAIPQAKQLDASIQAKVIDPTYVSIIVF